MIRSLWASIQGSPEAMRRLHVWLAWAWGIASIPICIWFNTSVPLLVFMSAYAIVTGHWSAAQAANVEVKQDEAQQP